MSAMNTASAFEQLSPVAHEEGSSEWFEHNQIEPNKTVTETSIGEGLLKSVMVCPHGRMLGRF